MDYRIVEGAEQIGTEDVIRLLHTTYWAEKRPAELIERSMRNSACYGVVSGEDGRLMGFARVISDWATTYYLCDVVIDPAYRGRGLGKALVGHIEALPSLSGLRGFLITRDAHGLYRHFGYEVVDGRVMAKLNRGSEGTC